MSEPSIVRIHTDGAARGNPGPAAFAYIIEQDGQPAIEESGVLGERTNNVAEYIALVRALEHAARLGARRLAIFTDSDLMVNQMNGRFKVKNPGLRQYWEQASRLFEEFDQVDIRHIPRAQNARADRLGNEALDRAAGKSPRPAPKGKTPASTAHKPRVESAREEALECLRAAAAAWARGDANHLKVEDVWDQLWSILEAAGVVRT